jgi:hypothetical protein
MLLKCNFIISVLTSSWPKVYDETVERNTVLHSETKNEIYCFSED